jgi:outer membrane protein OmpA-like peptidoglycan-associated protein
LQGQTADEAEPQHAGDLLHNVWGVRVVDNRIELAPAAKKYTWTAGRRGNRIRITGYVPNRATRKVVLGVAKANFPGFEVVDRMTTTRGVPPFDTWLGGVSFALKQLAGLKRGDVRLENLGIWIAGEADDVAAYRVLKSALGNGLPKGIKLIDDLVTAPVVSPFSWSAHFADGHLVLAGYVPTEAARLELLAAAKASLADGTFDDKMQPGEGAPPGWKAAAAASLRELPRLHDAGAEIRDAVLIISGLAQDAATAEAVRDGLRAALPATIKLTDHIKVKEPPQSPPPAVPATPAPTAVAPANDARPTVPDKAQASATVPVTPALPPGNETDKPAAPHVPDSTGSAAVPPPEAHTASVAEVQAKACEARLQSLVKDIMFDVASAELSSLSFAALDRLAETAKSCPDMRIEVRGYASAEGSAVTNQTLSIKRAKSVVTYLVRAGVDASQLKSVGYGASRPVAPNDTRENMAKNRRIEFKVSPK